MRVVWYSSSWSGLFCVMFFFLLNLALGFCFYMLCVIFVLIEKNSCCCCCCYWKKVAYKLILCMCCVIMTYGPISTACFVK